MKSDLVRHLDRHVDKLKPRSIIMGTVTAMMPGNIGRVMLTDGTMVSRVHIPFRIGEGGTVVCARPVGSSGWVAIGVVGGDLTGTMYGSGNRERDDEVAITRPPSGLSASETSELLVFQWSSWPDFDGAFEVQISETPDHSDASTVMVTKGDTYATAEYALLYVRVRAVSKAHVLSYFTGWLLAQRTPGVANDQVLDQWVSYKWHADGPLAVASEIDGVWSVPYVLEISSIAVYLFDTGSAGSTIADVEYSSDDGVTWASLFTTPSSRPEVVYSTTNRTADSTPEITVLDSGVWLRMCIDQVATKASGITVLLKASGSASYEPLLLSWIG